MYEVKESTELCGCGGVIDLIYIIEPNISRGRCFQCGKVYNVIRFDNKMSGVVADARKRQEDIQFSHEFRLTRVAADIIMKNLNKSPIDIGNRIVREFHSQGVVIQGEKLPAFGCAEYYTVVELVEEVSNDME